MDLENSQISRNLFAALCFVLPVLFYFGIFHFSINHIVWDGQSVARFTFSEDSYCVTGAAAPVVLLDVLSAIRRITHTIEHYPAAAEAAFKFRVAELAGRLDFILPSVLLRSVAPVSFAIACYIIWRSTRLDGFRLVIVMAVIIVAGCLVGSKMDAAHGTRFLLMDPILSAEPIPLISEEYLPSFDVGSFKLNHHAAVDIAIRVNLYLGAIAILALLAGLAAITAGQSLGGQTVTSTARELRERMGFLKALIGLEVAIFVLLIVITKTATDWVIGLVCPPEQAALTPIANTLKYYWGVGATGVIVSGLLPAYYAWSSDVSAYAESLASSKSFKDVKSLVEDQGLTFTPAQTILSLVMVALPALTPPFVDTMQRMAGLGS
jgi:hypothetical protein